MTDEPDDNEGVGRDQPGSDEEYRVGYKRPPLHSQFKQGESGNRRGRPKGAKNFRTMLLDVAMRKITLVRNGKPLRLTNLEHVIDAVRLRAAQGDPIAMSLVMRYGMPQPDEDEFRIPKGVLILGEKLTEDEWLEEGRRYAERTANQDSSATDQDCAANAEPESFNASPVIVSPK